MTMPDQLTPEEIQQARELAQGWVTGGDGECPAAGQLAEFVLALTIPAHDQVDDA